MYTKMGYHPHIRTTSPEHESRDHPEREPSDLRELFKSRLTYKERMLVTLIYHERMSHEEVAATLSEPGDIFTREDAIVMHSNLLERASLTLEQMPE